jgi:hypothetical protein
MPSWLSEEVGTANTIGPQPVYFRWRNSQDVAAVQAADDLVPDAPPATP